MSKSKSRRKYEQGDRITSLDQLYEQKFIFVNGKVYHHGWAGSWSMHLATNYIKRGCYKVLAINRDKDDQPRGEGPR